jgi:hypothetical protein
MDWPLLATMLLLSFALTMAIQSVRAIVRMAAGILRRGRTAHRSQPRKFPRLCNVVKQQVESYGARK